METSLKPHMSLAFNCRGNTYDHLVDEKYHGCTILTRPKTNTKTNMSQDIAPHLTPSGQEVTDEDEGQDAGLWVGMRVPSADSYDNQKGWDKTDASGGSRKKGRSIADNDERLITAYDPKTLRVVIYKGMTHSRCYALVNPENGLCQARKVEQNEVYFF